VPLKLYSCINKAPQASFFASFLSSLILVTYISTLSIASLGDCLYPKRNDIIQLDLRNATSKWGQLWCQINAAELLEYPYYPIRAAGAKTNEDILKREVFINGSRN
jgi:hypothetical protein